MSQGDMNKISDAIREVAQQKQVAASLPAFTKEEYLNWLATRATDPSEWTYADCVRADRCIRNESLKELERYMQVASMPKAIANFVRVCAGAHFGSSECDELFKELKLYPEWIDNQDVAR